MKEFFNTITFRPIQYCFFLLVIGVSVGLLATPYYKFAILPGLTILLLLPLSKYPQIGYYLIVFLLPFGAYRGLSGTYQFLKIHWIIAFWLIILLLLQFLVKKKTSIRLRSNLWPWFLIFFIISLVSALLSDYPLTSFDNLRLLLIAYMFVALNLIYISHKDFCRTLPIIIILSISISSFLGIIGYVFNLSLFAENVEIDSFKRGIGGAIDPNNSSLMIIFSLPLLVNWFFISRIRLVKSLSIALIVVNVIALMLTFSRGGALILVVMLFLIFFEHLRKFRPKHLGFTIFFVIAITVAAIFLPTGYWGHIKNVNEPVKDRAIGRRSSYLYVGWDIFKENPIMGSGPGSFRNIYASSNYALAYDRKGRANRRYAHNTYLEVLVGTGILGLIVFIILLWYALNNFHIAKKRLLLYGKKEMASIVGSYQLSFISLLIYLLLFSDLYHKYLLISLALSQVALRLSQEGNVEEHNECVNHSK